ncbi:hypothetical protein GpartN1_g3631.t1 [Galdieria partita]|uniref:Uncharacterized protein n=1 Tax=Galdieria partita TaxID=83374 RepID=A0A9C7PWK1_9RHOD|nr:hypothetical protein GpartN1_g3631.t1 [Galdieria partita]
MQNSYSSTKLLLERLEERKYCIQEIISKCLKDTEDLKCQFSKSATQLIEQLEDTSKAIDLKPLSTFCIPSESILFTPKEVWEEANLENNWLGRDVKVFKVFHVTLSSRLLVIAGERWVSFWLLPFRNEPDRLPQCDNLKWLESHLKVLNLVLSQDESYLLIQACEQLEYTTWEAGELNESSHITLYQLLFSLEDYSLAKSFTLSLPVECLMKKVRHWSVLLSCRQENTLYLYTISNKCSLYWMDLMEEALFLRRLSCDGLKLISVNRIGSNITATDEMDKCFICGLSDEGKIEVYQSKQHLLSFEVSALIKVSFEWIIPIRIYSDVQNDDHILNVWKEHYILAYVIVEWNISSGCYLLHFMTQNNHQGSVKVNSISLGFLGDKKLEKWNVSMNPTPLLWLSSADGRVLLIDIEHCQLFGSILPTKTENDNAALVDFCSFDNRAVAVWKNAPGLIHVWQNLHI